MTDFSHRLLAVVLFLLLCSGALADTRYISDRLIVTLRELPEATAKVIATLKTDESFEVLEEQDVYLKVRTGAGMEGYVKKQYVSTDTPKPVIIAGLKEEIARLEKAREEMESTLQGNESTLLKENTALKQQNRELQAARQQAEQELKARTAELQALQASYDSLQKDAADVVAIVNERQQFRDENERMVAENDSLREENAYLLRTGVIKWFLAGAGVLLAGWAIGKASRRKRRY